METHRWRQMGRSKAPKGLKKKKGKKRVMREKDKNRQREERLGVAEI